MINKKIIKKIFLFFNFLSLITTSLFFIYYHNHKNKKNNINVIKKIIKIKKKKKIISDQTVNEQETIIDEINNALNYIDVNNNIINTEAIRYQRCQTLINKINNYQNNQELYQLLLPLQKKIIIKQKLIKHYHQSIFGKIIIIVVNFFFTGKIFFLFYIMITSFLKSILPQNNPSHLYNWYFHYNENNLIAIDYDYFNYEMKNDDDDYFNYETKNNDDDYFNYETKNNDDQIKISITNIYFLIMKKKYQVLLGENKTIDLYFHEKDGRKIFLLYQLSYACCLFFFINYILNCLFNNDNERLYNHFNLFIHRYRYQKKTIAQLLFIDEKQIDHFLYDRSRLLFFNNQNYYYVPTLFDGTSNYFLNVFKLVSICFLFFFFIPYYCYAVKNFFFVQKAVDKIFAYQTNAEGKIVYISLLIKDLINNLFETLSSSLYTIKFNNWSFFSLLINKLIIFNSYFLIRKKKEKINKINNFNNNKITTINKKEISKKAITDYKKEKIITKLTKTILFCRSLLLSNKEIFFFFLFSFFFVAFFFDYLFTFLCCEKKAKNHFLTIIFYGQHYFNEEIKHFFKSLPIINKFYYSYPKKYNRFYLITLIIPLMLSILIIFINFYFTKIETGKKAKKIGQSILNDLFFDTNKYFPFYQIVEQFYDHKMKKQ